MVLCARGPRRGRERRSCRSRGHAVLRDEHAHALPLSGYLLAVAGRQYEGQGLLAVVRHDERDVSRRIGRDRARRHLVAGLVQMHGAGAILVADVRDRGTHDEAAGSAEAVGGEAGLHGLGRIEDKVRAAAGPGLARAERGDRDDRDERGDDQALLEMRIHLSPFSPQVKHLQR